MTRREYRSGQRWTVWRWTDVVIGGLLYLRRLHLVQTPWFAVMLHWIQRPDPQPDLHDHPVGFLSVPLRGWYAEEVPAHHFGQPCDVCGWFVEGRRPWRFKRATDRHRIVDVSEGGCLTLVFAGPVVRGWGFHTANGWVPWREYSK